MNGSWQSGSPRMQFRFGQGKKPGFFSLMIIALALALFLVFGIGLLMIAATLVVLLLPWLWWKKRKFIAQMQQAQAAYQAQQQDPAASGVIIEGEVLQREHPHHSNHQAQTQSSKTAQVVYVETVVNDRQDPETR